MTMESLPMETLTHILQYLSPIDRLHSEQVCRKWRDASRQTWRDVRTLYIVDPIKNRDYSYRFINCTKPHEFVQKEENRLFIGSDSPKIINCLVSRVGCFIRKLIYGYYSNKEYRAIFPVVNSYCHKLKILEIEHRVEDNDDKLLSILFQRNKELRSFKGHFLNNFIEALPLSDWRSLHFMSFGSPYEQTMISMIEHSENLEEYGGYGCTRRIVDALKTRRNLKSLDFYCSHRDTLEMIFDVPLLKRLTNLVIDSGTLDSHLFCNMMQHCRQLKRLGLAVGRCDVPMKAVEAILALPVLETLELHSILFPDDTLTHLIDVRNLRLGHTFRHQITNNGIRQLMKKSKVLEKLDIQNTGVTPGMFYQFVEDMSDRSKYLEVMVPYKIFNEVSSICAGSKIRVVKDMQCFRGWND